MSDLWVGLAILGGASVFALVMGLVVSWVAKYVKFDL